MHFLGLGLKLLTYSALPATDLSRVCLIGLIGLIGLITEHAMPDLPYK